MSVRDEDGLLPGMIDRPKTLDEIRHNAQIDADHEQQEMVIYTEQGRYWYADPWHFRCCADGRPRREVERVQPTPAPEPAHD